MAQGGGSVCAFVAEAVCITEHAADVSGVGGRACRLENTSTDPCLGYSGVLTSARCSPAALSSSPSTENGKISWKIHGSRSGPCRCSNPRSSQVSAGKQLCTVLSFKVINQPAPNIPASLNTPAVRAGKGQGCKRGAAQMRTKITYLIFALISKSNLPSKHHRAVVFGLK